MGRERERTQLAGDRFSRRDSHRLPDPKRYKMTNRSLVMNLTLGAPTFLPQSILSVLEF